MQIRRAYCVVLLAALAACVDRDLTAPITTEQRFQASLAGGETLIRIGVVEAASSITLGSAANYEVRERSSGVLLMSGANSAVTITMSGAVTRWKLQVTCSSANAVNALIAKASALGHPTYTEVIPACTRLLIGDFPLNASWRTRVNYKNLLISQGLATAGAFWRQITPSAVSYTVSRPGAPSVNTLQPPQLTSSDDFVTINGKKYRGAAYATVNSGGTLAGVNVLPMEQYLYGVVPLELGPIAYPEVEAQKVQAIAARTYALVGLNKRSSDGYDLRGTTSDQVYGGFAAEHPISTEAINATRGVALTYNGKLISALYSSTSGGHTADNEEAFAGAPVPYLRGVPDAQRGKAFEHVPSLEVFKAHGNPTSLRSMKEGDYDSNWGRLHRWTYEWTMEQISAVISATRNGGNPVGKVLAINVLARGPSGRVTSIEYVTEAGTFTHARDAIRTSLKTVASNGNFLSLPSTLFFVEPIIDHKTKELDGYRVYGGGFGHGVGMSQTGAVGMAEKKHTYDEILKHYYRDVELTTIY